MAVTKKNPRLKVWIAVHGVALEEHVDEDDQRREDSVTKYIEAISGAEYSIKVELQKPWPDSSILIDIYIDGKWVRGAFIMQKSFVGSSAEISITGVQHTRGDEWYTRKFCFSDLVVGKFVVITHHKF
jgi:hypothetical protein